MLKIFNCHSFPAKTLDRYAKNPEIYVPIGGGGYKDSYVRLADDTGDNISKYNSIFNEITVIYWVAKHIAELGDPDYIGFGHYRRYLHFDDIKKLRLDSNTVIVAKRDNMAKSVYEQYAKCHVKGDMDAFIKSSMKFFRSRPEILMNFYHRTLSAGAICS